MKKIIEILLLMAALTMLLPAAAGQGYGTNYPDEQAGYAGTAKPPATYTPPVQQTTYVPTAPVYQWEKVTQLNEIQWRDTDPERYLYSYKQDWRYNSQYDPYEAEQYNYTLYDGYYTYYQNKDPVEWEYLPYLCGRIAYSYKTYYYFDADKGTWTYWTYRAYKPDNYIETYTWESKYSPYQIKLFWLDYPAKKVTAYYTYY